MSEYILDVASMRGKVDWPGSIQRSGAFPLDRSSVFSSLADAELYISGQPVDSRGLGATVYAGQFISVYDSDKKQIVPYLIQFRLNESGEISGLELQEIFISAPNSNYYIDGGNAEKAEEDFINSYVPDISYNLLNPDEIWDDYYIDYETGILTARGTSEPAEPDMPPPNDGDLAWEYVTGYIQVNAGDILTLQATESGTRRYVEVNAYAYDSDFNYIAGAFPDEPITEVLVPEGTYYIRLHYWNEELTDYAVVHGTTLLPYVAY